MGMIGKSELGSVLSIEHIGIESRIGSIDLFERCKNLNECTRLECLRRAVIPFSKQGFIKGVNLDVVILCDCGLGFIYHVDNIVVINNCVVIHHVIET